MKIGNKLRHIRIIKGLKQDAMSDLLGISQPAYSKMENDETDISISRLSQIAEKLGCKEEDILAFDEKYVFQNCTNAGINQSQFTVNGKELIDELLRTKDELLKTKDLIYSISGKYNYQSSKSISYTAIPNCLK